MEQVAKVLDSWKVRPGKMMLLRQSVMESDVNNAGSLASCDRDSLALARMSEVHDVLMAMPWHITC